LTLSEVQNILKKRRAELSEEFGKFKQYFTDILKDFQSKGSTKEIILLAVRSEVIPMIEPLIK
jgi:hypothetical protein